MEDQIRRTNNWIYKIKKSNLDHPSGPMVQRIEAWALSEDSGFNSYPSRPEGYLVKNGMWLTTSMEGSNYWGYVYKTQHSNLRSQLITWRRPEVKFSRNVVRKTNKNYQDEWMGAPNETQTPLWRFAILAC